MKIRLASLSLLLVFPLYVWANNSSLEDQYYSSDIFNAINEAKIRTHHYDYSQSLRYDRTTSQSIQIPRLLNQEMAKTIIETPDEAVDETSISNAASKTDIKISDTPSTDTRLVQQSGSASFSAPGFSSRAYANP